MKKELKRKKKGFKRYWRDELIAMKRAKGDAQRWTMLVWSLADE